MTEPSDRNNSSTARGRPQSLRVTPNGKILISPEQLRNAIIVLPEELRQQNLTVVFMQNQTSTTVGLCENPPPIPLTPIDDLRIVRQINREVAAIHNSTLTESKEESLKDPYVNVKIEAGQSFKPDPSLKPELLANKNLIVKIHTLKENLSEEGKHDDVPSAYCKRILKSFEKSIEDFLIDLGKGVKRNLLHYLAENKVPKWFYDRINSTRFNPTQIHSYMKFLYPNKGESLRLTGKEIFQYHDPFYDTSRYLVSVQKKIHEASKQRVVFDNLQFTIIPPMKAYDIISTGVRPVKFSIEDDSTKHYHRVASLFFGKLPVINTVQVLKEEFGYETERYKISDFISFCEQKRGQDSPLEDHILQKEWLAAIYETLVPVDEIAYIQTPLNERDFTTRIFRPARGEFVEDQFWNSRRPTQQAQTQLRMRTEYRDVVILFNTLNKTERFKHLAIPIANLLSNIGNAVIRTTCISRIKGALASARLVGNELIINPVQEQDSDNEDIIQEEEIDQEFLARLDNIHT